MTEHELQDQVLNLLDLDADKLERVLSDCIDYDKVAASLKALLSCYWCSMHATLKSTRDECKESLPIFTKSYLNLLLNGLENEVENG